jgi:hypothetical protein
MHVKVMERAVPDDKSGNLAFANHSPLNILLNQFMVLESGSRLGYSKLESENCNEKVNSIAMILRNFI